MQDDSQNVGRCFEDLPILQTVSLINNIPHLSSIDPEMNVPSKVNFDYFNITYFNSSPELQTSSLQKSLSVLNCNITSTFFFKIPTKATYLQIK